MGHAVMSAGQPRSARSPRTSHGVAWRSLLWLLLAFPALALADLEAEDDAFVGREDTPLTRNVFGNDSQDPGLFGLESFTQPSHGSVSFDTGGNFTYNPDGDYSGPDEFTYTIQPIGGPCLLPVGLQPPYCADRETATVDLDVLADADPPIISASNVVGDEDTSIALTLSAAVADTDGSETLEGRLRNVPSGAVVSGATEESPGIWVIPGAAFGGLAITPPLNANGVVSLEFSVTTTDTASNTDTETLGASFNVQVNPVDDPPTVLAAPAPVSVPEDGAIAADLSGIFSDVDSPLALSIASIGGDAVTVTGTETIGGLTLTADLVPEANGTVTFEIEADDGVNAPVSATLTVNVTPVNDTPVLIAPLADVDVNEDAGTINVSVAGSFDDADITTNGDALTYTLATSGDSLFSSTSVAGTTLNFTLAPNANGAVSVLVTATDNASAFAQDSFALVVNPVNDAPTVVNPIGTVALPEDAPPQSFDLSKVFDDVDILTNGDILNFTIASNTNPGLFSDLSISGDKLTLEVAPDTNGTATVVIEASDGDVTVSDSFTVTVAFVNDIPIPEDDAVTMVEDSGAILIDVLANDFQADAPATIFSAGSGGFSDSTSNFRYLDTNGDTVDEPDGTVTIVGNQIQYEPEANFVGTDTFTYKIQDCCLPDESNPGEVSVEATVTVTVLPENDPPEPNAAVRTFTMFTNDTLVIDSNLSLIRDTYDLEYSTLDPATGDPVGGTITASVVSAPDAGGAFSFASDGTFSYTPPIDYQGITTFTYLVQDDLDSAAAVNTVRIDVREPPAPATPPTPGEVAVTFDLATTPLEQANGVTPNVLIMMDDSGSMDWNITSQGEANEGIIRLSNEGIATENVASISYPYLWPLADNSYLDFYFSGLSAVTEETLRSDPTNFGGNQYGAWRSANAGFNATYYNPELRYTPWVGFDNLNVAFADAVPTAARLNPIDPSATIDLTQEITYISYLIPIWATTGGNVFSIFNTTYIPHYYTSSATGVPDWDDNLTEPVGGQAGIEGLVEICAPTATNCAGPSSGFYAGSEARTDCANPLQCTYDEEIQNFANWFQYYRKREFVAKAAVASVLEDVNDLRVGYETLNQRASVDVEEMNDLTSEGHKKLLYDSAFGVNSISGTPLRDALERAGEIYRCTDANRTCPVLPAPDGTCQQNFTLLFSDGFWNGAAGVSGDQDADALGNPWDGGVYADGRSDTLADTAMFYYKTDLHTNLEDRVVPTSRDRAARVTGEFEDGDRMHQHMKTFTIAFGVEGSLDPTSVPTDPTTAFTWPDPLTSDAAKVDDMLHAAVNGRGEFLSAANVVDLRNAVQDAFDEFSDAQSSTSAASFNSTSLREGTLLYRGFYDLEDSTGELTASAVDDAGVVSATPTWRATEELAPENKPAAQRLLVTYDALARDGIAFDAAELNANQLAGLTPAQVNYLRGDQSGESENGGTFRDRSSGKLLGDIVHSSPVFVGEPRGFNRDQAPYPTSTGNLYSDFRELRAERTPMVYVGANDGMLHGFSAATGEELFGYVPNMVIDDSARFASDAGELTDPFYSHNYYVDLTPRINDVFIKQSATSSAKSWNSVLVGGLGAGGKGYYALNITNPTTAFSSLSNAEDVVLWEFTEEDDTYPVESDGTPLGGAVGAVTDPDGRPVKDLGYALSLPTLAMSNADDGTDKDWVALFGNGPNSTAGVAKLFVLFLDGGLDGWDDPGDFVKISTERGVPISDPPELIGYPNGLGSPTAVDEDLNGTVDLVYAGDRLGNLYRFDLRDSDPDNWEAVLIFTASYDNNGTVERQPILERPLVLPHPTEDGFLITFGTGSYVTDDDASDDSIQSIYGIWDVGTGSSPVTASSKTKELRLGEQTITNIVDDTVTPALTRRVPSDLPVNYRTETSGLVGVYGWYIDLDMPRATTTTQGAINTDTSGQAPPDAQFPGERAVRRFLVRNGNIITSTVLPSNGQASCFGTRPGAILLFSAASGGVASSPTIDFNRDGVIDEGDLVDTGNGLYAGGVLLNQNDLDGSLVDLSTLGGQGDTDFLFISGGNDTVSVRIEDVNDPRTGRLSWSELVNED